MSDPTNTATPPAGITKAEVTSILEGALKGFGEQIAAKLGEIQKASAEGLTGLRKEFGESLAKISPGLKAEDLAKAVSEQLTQRDTAAKGDKARADFIAKDLKGIPAIYAGKLGTDPAKWGEEAKAIREGYQADLKSAGVKAPPVSTTVAGGQAPAAPARDLSKLNGHQLIALGVEESAANPVLTMPTVLDPKGMLSSGPLPGTNVIGVTSAGGGQA